jgi:hypothetical protein
MSGSLVAARRVLGKSNGEKGLELDFREAGGYSMVCPRLLDSNCDW